MTTETNVPNDGTDSFWEGYELDDNPFPELEQEFDEWDKDFLEAHKNYKEEGRVADGTFQGA